MQRFEDIKPRRSKKLRMSKFIYDKNKGCKLKDAENWECENSRKALRSTNYEDFRIRKVGRIRI